MQDKLRFGRLGDEAVHLCIDMQRLFGAGSDWAIPWIGAVRPVVARLAAARPARTVFTRFVPPAGTGAGGAWARYYAQWPQMLRERLDPAWLELLPELDRHVPPARVFVKPVYSPWHDGRLHRLLRGAGITTLVMTGGETDICVLATVMGAVDLGYRVVLVSDGVCSSADPGHDAAMVLYRTRLSQQVETAPLAEILESWAV